jgi:alpha-tubulin suppressor-like RCC1 family protein
MAAMSAVRVRSVAAGFHHSLDLGWDGRVYSWGENRLGQLGHGDRLIRPAPALVQGLDGVRGISAAASHGLAVTQSGAVFNWGYLPLCTSEVLWPIMVEGLAEVHVHCACAGGDLNFAIGENDDLFLWGRGQFGQLGHGDYQNQPSPKRVEALRDVRVSNPRLGPGMR